MWTALTHLTAVEAGAVYVVMAQAIYILIIKVNKLFSFFSSRCFLKEIENMYSVFLFKQWSVAVEELPADSCPAEI